MVVTRRFDPNTATVLQRTLYTCSLGSTGWCLASLGIEVSQEELEGICVPGMVNEELGLLNGSGATLAQLLRDRWGLAADHQSPISFDEIAARAGRQPLMIGGGNWNLQGTGHWVAVRGFQDDQLILANPGGTGPVFGQQALDRDAFAQRAPFAAVWIDVGDGSVADVAAPVAAPITAADPPIPGNTFRVANTGGEGARLRSQQSTSGERLRGLAEGTTVDGAQHAWRQVTDAQGARGWVADDLLAPAGNGFRVANTGGEGARLRSQPSTSGDRIKGLAEGAMLSGAEHAWRHVVTADGIRGWVADDLLARVGGAAARDSQAATADDQDAEEVWTAALGMQCCGENYWDPNGQPNRRAAMERFNQLPFERRRAIFERAMDEGLTAEGIADGAARDHWKQAMRAIALGGPDFPGENPDLNPFMLAGESGGVFRGGADKEFGGLNSSALGYFQFLSQKYVPIGQAIVPADCDYGHWRAYGPFPDDYGQQTSPVCQVRQFIRAIRASGKHHGDPMSVVREKSTPPHVWGP